MKVLVVQYGGEFSRLTKDIAKALEGAGHEVVYEVPEDVDKIRGMKFDFCLVDEHISPLHQSE